MLGEPRPVAEERDKDGAVAQKHIAWRFSSLGGTDPGRLQRNVELRNKPQGGLGLLDHGDLQTHGHWRSPHPIRRGVGHADHKANFTAAGLLADGAGARSGDSRSGFSLFRCYFGRRQHRLRFCW
jgi:hypothetical protein